MEYITYSKDGQPISDFGLETEFQIFKKYGGSRNYSTENIFNRIRLAIINEEIENNVCFVFENTIYGIDEYGKIIDWPKGFCDYNINICEKILKAVIDKYKQNRIKIGE